jgi:hypothetical protein
MSSKKDKIRQAAYDQQRYGAPNKDQQGSSPVSGQDPKIKELSSILHLPVEECAQLLLDHDNNVEQAIHSAMDRDQWHEVARAKVKVCVLCLMLRARTAEHLYVTS